MSTHYQQGLYRCEIVDQGLSQSSTQKPQIWLRILPKEFLDDPDLQLQNYERTVYWTITEKTVDFVTEKLTTLGFTGDSFRQLDLNHQNPESFVGQLEDFYCKHETYNGEEREKWDLSRGDFEQKPLEESEARKLDALFGRKLKDATKGKKKATVNKELAVSVEGFGETSVDEDVPF